MLQHEAQTEPSSFAAGTRVTPQELAEAVATLEARKETEAQRHADTITIGDALHQLGLSASEEELLNEVETLRKQREAKARQESKTRAARRILFCLTATILCLVIAALGTMNFRLRHRLQEVTHTTNPLAIQQLAGVPDGQIVHCDAQTLGSLALNNRPQDQISVDARAEISDSAHTGMFNKEWSIVRQNGQIYVNAWATADQALAAGNGQEAELFSNRPLWLPAANVVTLQLPVYRFTRGTVHDYSAQGAKLTDSTGVTQQFAIDTLSQNIEDVVKHKVLASEPELNPYSLKAELKNGTVHLSSMEISQAHQKHVMAVAAAALQEAHIPYRVVFDAKNRGRGKEVEDNSKKFIRQIFRIAH